MCFGFVPLEVYVVRRRKMKFYLRILLLLMAAVLALSVFVGCDTGGDVGDDTDVDETNDPTSIFPDVERKDYSQDFNIFAVGENVSWQFYITEDTNSGTPIDEAIFRRQNRVEKYLGIDIIGVKYPDSAWNTYNKNIQSAVQNMDGTLDAFITHPHGAISNLISDNLIVDLSEFEGIDLDAEYWNKNVMNSLELKGNYYLGYSDYNLVDTYVIAFNKEMLAKYASSMDKSIYDVVRDREWTLDKMIDLASNVYADATGNGKSKDDTFGISGSCWVGFCGFLTSSNIPMMMQDQQSGNYKVALSDKEYQGRADGLIEKLRDLDKSNFAFFDHPSTTGYSTRSVPLSSGRTLMETIGVSSLSGLLSYNVEFGVLPYPMYDLSQANVGYKSLQWGGYIAVPSYVKNPIMTGEALEMLSFYSEPVRVTYYEKQLGKQVADVPDDVAMLDIVWDSVSTDIGQTFEDMSSGNGFCYTVPKLLDPAATQNLASFINARETLVNTAFRKFIEGLE